MDRADLLLALLAARAALSVAARVPRATLTVVPLIGDQRYYGSSTAHLRGGYGETPGVSAGGAGEWKVGKATPSGRTKVKKFGYE